MARYSFERLSAQDYQFFAYERDNTPMHASSTLVFKAGCRAHVKVRTPKTLSIAPRRKEGQNQMVSAALREQNQNLLARKRVKNRPLGFFAPWRENIGFNLQKLLQHSQLTLTWP